MSKRALIVRTVFALLFLWTIWFCVQLARPGTDVASEMMQKFSRALDSSYDSTRAVYAAFFAVAISTYNWVDLVLPFVIDITSLVRTLTGPLWRFLAPILVWVSHHLFAAIRSVNDTVSLKYKLGGSMIIFVFIRVEKFAKVFLLNLIFFILIFDFTKPILIHPIVRIIFFVAIPVVLSLFEVSRQTTQSARLGNLILYLTILPVFIGMESISKFPKLLEESRYASVYVSPTWAGLISLLLCLGTPIRVTGWRFDWLIEDLGVSTIVHKGVIPLGSRLGQKLVDKYPSVARIPSSLSSVRSRIVSFGFENFSTTGGLSISSIVRGRWSLFAVIIISIILIGYFAYTALTLFVSIAVWPWFFMESLKVMKLEIVSEYRSHLSFILLFLSYEFFLVRSNFTVVTFFASMLHLPALLVLKIASGMLLGRAIDVVKSRATSPRPDTSPEPSPKKND